MGASRVSIKDTRNMITSILNGSADNAGYIKEQYFGLMIPLSLNNIDKKILNPINSWKSEDEYKLEAVKLAEKFKSNFKIYGKKVEYLINSGPVV